MASCFKHGKTAAVRLLSIEIALKTDLMTTLALYHQHFFVRRQEDKGGITGNELKRSSTRFFLTN